MKSCIVLVLCLLIANGVFGVEVETEDGDSLTLNTNHNINQSDKIIWYVNNTDIPVAQINSVKSCTDVQCDVGNERFRDRLQLNNQTGSLTIRNISTTDSGLYRLKISSSTQKTFNVTVSNAFGKTELKTVKEGDSVTLNTDVIDIQIVEIMEWMFEAEQSLIAKISRKAGNLSTYYGVDGRFKDRLQLDNQTGSLTIKNTSTTDSGLYKLHINTTHLWYSTRSTKNFSVTINGSGVSLGLVAGIIVGVQFLAAVVVGVIFCCRSKSVWDGVHVIYMQDKMSREKRDK